ncbi:MAG TPA: ATP-binding protein [Thermoanaerobaculia bacterium]|nr:ATP-binding protein [Thermoanaerobaculia bacterium]
MTRHSSQSVAVEPMEIESRRRERRWRLAAIELPLVRVIGSVLLSLAVYVHNVWILPTPTLHGWAATTLVAIAWAGVTWAALAYFLRREPPIDLTIAAFTGDLLVWTFAIYHSGAESSWLFFILLLRVADQTQTTFRRATGFALVSVLCYTGMLGWVMAVDHRDIPMAVELAKLGFLFLGGFYIALAARTAERRRAQLTDAVRVSRELIRKLEEASARAEEASAAKSEFVANVSHEMRTPLQAVIGILQLSIEDETSETTVRRLDTARRSAETLLSMIDDVLDFARIEARKLELEPVYFELRRAIADTMKSLGVIAASKKLTLSYLVQPDVPEVVWGDAVRLRQILVNLVGNAIKFTHDGEIAVHVQREEKGVRFDVRDTGVGIAPAVRQRIFEPFAQLDSKRTSGAGLGLSIVVRLLEAMGGTVQVASQPGTGSVFSFVIPLPVDPIGTAPDRRRWEQTLSGRAVLVVEPADLSRAAIAEILRSRGIFASAYARVSDVPRGRFVCAVTADPNVFVTPRVVITSPLESKQYPHQVTRPIVERELLDAIGNALGLTNAASDMTLTPRVAPSRGARVLLVDDNEVNREVLGEMLRRLGHTVTLAADGEEAMALLATRTYDCIFTDVQLPQISGLELTCRFRQAGGRTPIIAITAHTAREDRERCLAAGMNLVLTKPVDSAQLANAIDATVARESELRDYLGDNAPLLARVREAFERQTPELLASMRDALARGDADALARHAHKLKGSLSYFPGRGENLAREVEGAARAGELNRAAGLIPEVESAVEKLRETF